MSLFVSTFIFISAAYGSTKQVVGVSCDSNPQVFARINGKIQKIFCFKPERHFYAGISMLVAQKAHISKCQNANLLDPSGNYKDADPSCFKRCLVDTQCILDNR